MTSVTEAKNSTSGDNIESTVKENRRDAAKESEKNAAKELQDEDEDDEEDEDFVCSPSFPFLASLILYGSVY